MKLLDVLNAPWAIEPGKLREIQAIYATHLRGEKIDIAGVEARIGRPLDNQPKDYAVLDGVAVLPIEGVIAKRANLFMQISGGTSSELVARDLRQARADPAVHSIILLIDSPGGTVDGTQALADLVAASRDTKPIATLAGGAMASAAYWIGSAAGVGRVYIADSTTAVGSIGVVATHVDVSGAEAQRGVKTTEIYAGKYKRVASQYAPLSETGRQTIQDQVDYTYSLFVGAVAQQRGVSAERVLAEMADGRIFIGQQAVDVGLVDGVSTLDALIAKLNRERSAGAAQPPRIPSSKGVTMSLTREQVEAQAPDIVAAIRAEATAQGAQAERQRIQAVEKALIPGHEALVAALKFDGTTSGGDAAMAVIEADRKVRSSAAARLAAEAPNPLPPAATPAVDPPKQLAADDKDIPVEERCKAKWDSSAELRREFSSLTAYTAYARASEAGQARVYTK